MKEVRSQESEARIGIQNSEFRIQNNSAALPQINSVN